MIGCPANRVQVEAAPRRTRAKPLGDSAVPEQPRAIAAETPTRLPRHIEVPLRGCGGQHEAVADGHMAPAGRGTDALESGIAIPEDRRAIPAKAPIRLAADGGWLEWHDESETQSEGFVVALFGTDAFEIGIPVPEQRAAFEAEPPVGLPRDSGRLERQDEGPPLREVPAVPEDPAFIGPRHQVRVLDVIGPLPRRDIAEEDIRPVAVPGVRAQIHPDDTVRPGVVEQGPALGVD